MNSHNLTRYLVLFLLGLGTITTLFGHAHSFDEQVELDHVDGVKHWLPIDFHVQPGEQPTLTVSGSQLFHDALLVTTKDSGIELNLDLVVLCPESRQPFAKRKSFSSKLYKNFKRHQEKREGWRLELGNDCEVSAKDLGYPTVELSTANLAWIEVSNYATLIAKEMVAERVGINTRGLSSITVDHIQAERAHIKVTGSSNLSVSSIDADETEVSLNGLADFELDSLVSPKIEFTQSGSSDCDTTSVVTHRFVLVVTGLSEFFASKVQSPMEETDSGTEVSSIDVSGSAEVAIQNLMITQLELKVNGLSDLELGPTITNRLKLTAAGSSDVSFKSLSTGEIQIDTSGLADVQIQTLDSDEVEIRASGVADVEVQSAEVGHLDVRSKGLSDVSIKRQHERDRQFTN